MDAGALPHAPDGRLQYPGRPLGGGANRRYLAVAIPGEPLFGPGGMRWGVLGKRAVLWDPVAHSEIVSASNRVGGSAARSPRARGQALPDPADGPPVRPVRRKVHKERARSVGAESQDSLYRGLRPLVAQALGTVAAKPFPRPARRLRRATRVSGLSRKFHSPRPRCWCTLDSERRNARTGTGDRNETKGRAPTRYQTEPRLEREGQTPEWRGAGC